jgi:hypothetical protein
MRTLSVVVLVGILSAVSGPASARQADPLSPASGAILQADGPAAGRLLGAIDVGALSDEGRRQHACMVGRLDPATPLPALAEDASFSERALHAYRVYWREAIGSPDDRLAAEARLKARLAVLLDRPETADLESLMIERIRSEGRFVLAGQTGRLLELMLWSKQEERDFKVSLPEGSHTTRVFMLDGFESRGWSNWMTCDRTGTGGWTKPEGLYAIVPAYGSFDDEDFAVNFLAHETQHFSDNASWTDMPAWQLEYRAKLAELALARGTRAAVLARFSNNQSDDPAEPHSYANRRVLTILRQRLGLPLGSDIADVPSTILRRAARMELIADTASRPTPPGRS